MKLPRTDLPSLSRLMGIALALLATWSYPYPSISAERVVPPPQPSVAPLIAERYPNDADGDRVEDQLLGKAQQALALEKSAVTGEQKAAAQAQLTAMVDVELVFSEQINENQMRAFAAQGGRITYVYKAVSYGWNGRLPLGKVAALPALLGDRLLLVEEAKPAQWHLDLATRTGRVRPIWGAGFAGNPSGFDGNTNITIAIVDTGVDESHSDLIGRRVYWHDFTADNSGGPIDFIQHGSHVAGIALGTGSSGGSGTGTLFLSDEGTLSGVPNGSFYPNLIDLPADSITFTITARWNGGGSTTLHLTSHAKGTSSGFSSHGSVSGTSPLTLVVTVTGDPTRAYTPALLSNGSTTDYVVTSQIANYPGSGDSFNRLRGVAPGCRWAGAKVFDNAGNGSSTEIGAAIDELVSNRSAYNIKVMNLSLGFIGNPGLVPTIRQKINTAVNNGIVAVLSAGNDGLNGSPGAREIDDPGRAAMALTVAAANDVNQLTDYSSQGFGSPSSTAGQQEDYKPDLMAPGGSSYYTFIASVDSNSGDGAFADQRANDYLNISGTSMASPFAAGCAALVIDALQQNGVTWDFNSSQHSRLVKMVLCATSSESNTNRENNNNNPTLQRASTGPNGFPAGKDRYEGYGLINPDSAIEAISLVYTSGVSAIATLGPATTDRRVWARTVNLVGGQAFSPTLTVPGSGDFDLYLYSRTPSAYGTPVILASSTQAGSGVTEFINYSSATNAVALLVVKRISGSGTFTLTANGPPIVDFMANVTNGLAPFAVTFTNLSSGATNYSWAFGDDKTSSAVNPTNTYTNAGSYTVTLTATGAGGTNSLTRTNYIVATNALPLVAANFTGSATNGLAPLTVVFTNLSSGATNYSWVFGDGKTSTAVNPTNTYTNAGSYTVTLTATGASGINSLSRTNYIVATNVLPPVVADFAGSPTNGLAPLTVLFTNLSSGATDYSWDFGDGQFSTSLNPSNTYTNAGAYTVSLIAMGGTGTNTLTRTNFILVTNPAPVAADFAASPTNGAAPLAVFFTNLSSGATNYTWDFGDGNTNSAVNPTNIYTNAGAYSIALTVIGAGGTNALTRSNYVVVTNVPPTIAGLIPVTGVAYAQDFDGMGSSGTNTPFGWYVGTGTGTISGTNVEVTTGSTSSGGNYNFGSSGSSERALGSLVSGGTPRDTEARFVNVSGSSIVSFTISYTGEQWRDGGPFAVTNNLVMQYSTDGSNFVAMGSQFNFNTPVDSGPAGALDGNAPSNRVTGIGGTYTPAVVIANGQVFYLRWADADNTSNDHGMAVDDFAITFTLTNAAPVVVADFVAASTSAVAPLTVSFTNLSSGATDYVWDFGDGNSSTNADPANTYTNAGSYTVSLTAIGFGGTNTLARTNYIVVTNSPPPPIIVDFIAGPTSGVAPLLVSFTNLSAGASTYMWDLGDGTTSTNENPANVYTNPASYTVSLTVVGAGGTNALARTNYIVVIAPALLVVAPASLDFGLMPTGVTARASLLVSNAGAATLTGSAAIAPSPFAIDSGSPFNLNASGWTNVLISFAPTGEGQFSNAVVFASNSGNSTNALLGRSISAGLLLISPLSDQDLALSFATLTGFTYVVQYKDSLDDAIWQTLQSVPGDGTVMTITNSASPAAQRFFQLRVE